jgi:hypothetical protein
VCKQDLPLWRSQVPTLQQARSDKANARGSEGERASGFQLRAARELSGWKFEANALVDRQLVHSEWAESEDDARNKAVVWISKRMNGLVKWNT